MQGKRGARIAVVHNLHGSKKVIDLLSACKRIAKEQFLVVVLERNGLALMQNAV